MFVKTFSIFNSLNDQWGALAAKAGHEATRKPLIKLLYFWTQKRAGFRHLPSEAANSRIVLFEFTNLVFLGKSSMTSSTSIRSAASNPLGHGGQCSPLRLVFQSATLIGGCEAPGGLGMIPFKAFLGERPRLLRVDGGDSRATNWT